jgi:calcium-dependent protein kinase
MEEKVDEETCRDVLANLTKFRATETLKMATYTFMASQMVSKGEKEKLANMFKAFDKNGDGKLDKTEILTGYESQGKIISMEEIDEIFARIDIDGSGFIDYNEFIAASMDMDEMLTTEKL